MSPQPNCCQHPTLRTLRAIDQAPDGEVVLQMCDTCATYWRVTVNGQFNMEDGGDGDIEFDIEWFDRLEDIQGNEILFGRAG